MPEPEPDYRDTGRVWRPFFGALGGKRKQTVLVGGCPKCKGSVFYRHGDGSTYCDACGIAWHPNFQERVREIRIVPDPPAEDAA